MSEPSINAQIAAQLLKTGVEVLELSVENEVDQTLATEDGYVVTRGTGVTTLSIKIYDPSRDGVK